MKENLKIVNTDNGMRLEVQGDFTITTYETLKKEIVSSLSREGNETLDLTNASQVDVVGVQLAYAWKKALEKQHRTAIVILPESESIKDLFVKTGITQIL
jgi:anti-anti-sigma regulatory factor